MSVSETGSDVLSRLSLTVNQVPARLEETLFPDGGPNGGELVEIVGESNTGKSRLLLDLIARIVLPVNCAGHELGAVLIDCENSFEPAVLLDVMEKYILNYAEPAIAATLDRPGIERIQDASLHRLQLITCYSLEQFDLTLLSLDNVFLQQPDISYVLVDSIATFYWTKCTPANRLRMETYQLAHCQKFKRIAEKWNKAFVYTKPAYFANGESGRDIELSSDGLLVENSSQGSTSAATTSTPTNDMFPPGKGAATISLPVDYRIELCESDHCQTPPGTNEQTEDEQTEDEQRFCALIKSKENSQPQYTRFYLIDKFGFNWIDP
ncbi:DNA repair protein XRCC2-like [Anopheles bellator]|uniref:DNA repair protein XRCC2-like n=1 Tax=Anopheles bellator TaxID=139047 RepID=UPI0026481EF4|nr:DNA repair protein XRCC2-like [Anopheles bellator]